MLTKEKVEALAPDKSSLDAALKLTKPNGWPLLATDAAKSLVWGECQGSGATPYRVNVALADTGYRCSCPSRKFPCKHVLAILLMHIDQPARFATADTPDWVRDWLARRRKSGSSAPTAKPATADDGATETEASGRATPPMATDPAKLEAQRKRQREVREARIEEGLLEFDQWLLDQLKSGLGDFSQVGVERCRTAARRLADAQAPGLATMIDQIPADALKLRPDQRRDFVIEQLGLAYLAAAAYRKQTILPEPLRADVRRSIGWSLKRDEVLSDPTALRSTGRWIVVGTRSVLQADALRRLETWLMRSDGDNAGRFASLIDFVSASTGATGSSFYPGEEIEADVVFYPSAMPLRAVLAQHKATDAKAGLPSKACAIATALDQWDDVLALQPFVQEWPLAVSGARVVATSDGRLALTDAVNADAMPIAAVQHDHATPLLGLDSVDTIGLWNGRSYTLLMAETPIGRWIAA